MQTRTLSILVLTVLLLMQSGRVVAQQKNLSARDDPSPGGVNGTNSPKTGNKRTGTAEVTDAAADARRELPVLPALNRGRDGILNILGTRATQNLLVTSTNIKDPVTDALLFSANLPVEAAEAVQIPAEQFVVMLPKFYATVPVLDIVSKQGWRYSIDNPFFAFARETGGITGLRSATPAISATGPAGRRVVLFESFGYRLAESPVDSVLGGSNDTRYQSYDWNQHADITAWPGHQFSGRLALFSQDVDSATLSALVQPEATPDFLGRGGQLYVGHTFTAASGFSIESSLSARRLRLHVLPRGTDPMELIEQGLVLGNYFDTVHESANRFEWKESLRLRDFDGAGRHQISLGSGFARSSYELTHIGNRVILRGEDEDEVASITEFAGPIRDRLSARDWTGWGEDKWGPAPRASFTLGLRYDRGSIARQNQWAPRVGFALLPFRGDQTVLRGGFGVFYDLMPLIGGTFTTSRNRVVQFFDEGVPEAEPSVLANLLATPRLDTPRILGWNLELDHRLTNSALVRIKAEERRGRDLLLINPNVPTEEMTALVLSNGGTSRYREIEATLAYRAARFADLNASYVRSESVGDLNLFTSTMGAFEKLFISGNRYARSRSDAPNRFLFWGDVHLPGSFLVTSAMEVHTGFPYAFVDGDSKVAAEADFGRFPTAFTLDAAVYRDFTFKALDRAGRLRLGLKVYNITNHFNPRDAHLGENDAQTGPEFKGFLDGPARTYRLHATFSF